MGCRSISKNTCQKSAHSGSCHPKQMSGGHDNVSARHAEASTRFCADYFPPQRSRTRERINFDSLLLKRVLSDPPDIIIDKRRKNTEYGD